MLNNGVHFMHIREDGQKGGVSIAYKSMDIEGMEDHVEVGVAYCNPKDNFCRRTGRVKAAGRLKSEKLRSIIDVGGAVDLNTVAGRTAAQSAIREALDV